MTGIKEALAEIEAKIERAARSVGRLREDITLLAVSKGASLTQVEEALSIGLSHFGENRVQESHRKFVETKVIEQCKSLHFIGPLQKNKVNKVVGIFDVIHSVDRLSLGEKIDREALKQGLRQKIYIEVNIAAEAGKHGVTVEEAPSLIQELQDCKNLSVLGLMAIPPKTDRAERARPYFKALRSLGNEFGLHEFSMGMSGDYEVAIGEGATCLRIGSALFGKRKT